MVCGKGSWACRVRRRLSGDSRFNFEMHVGVWEFPKTGDPNVVP